MIFLYGPIDLAHYSTFIKCFLLRALYKCGHFLCLIVTVSLSLTLPVSSGSDSQAPFGPANDVELMCWSNVEFSFYRDKTCHKLYFSLQILWILGYLKLSNHCHYEIPDCCHRSQLKSNSCVRVHFLPDPRDHSLLVPMDLPLCGWAAPYSMIIF